MGFSIPSGHHSITPGLTCTNAQKVVEFLQNAFGGELKECYEAPDGSIAHAEVQIQDSVIMLGEAASAEEAMPIMASVYVEGAEAVDQTFHRALDAGATPEREPANQFYGHRSGTVKDMGGNLWSISAVIEELSEVEITERMNNLDG